MSLISTWLEKVLNVSSQQITDGGALECHTDDTTCCRGRDNPPNGPGRGEWYYPDGTVVPPPGGGTRPGFYRTRDHMIIRLNRIEGTKTLMQTGVYRLCDTWCWKSQYHKICNTTSAVVSLVAFS